MLPGEKFDGRHAGAALDAVVAAHGARVLEQSEAMIVLEQTGTVRQKSAQRQSLVNVGVFGAVSRAQAVDDDFGVARQQSRHQR